MFEINSKPNNIITYTKINMSPLEPKLEDISIYDIAHSLSYMCRANGHIGNFFSVAQHCINCCREAANRAFSERLQLALLLHDGSEAYLADITRPVKHNLQKYLEIENMLQTMIYKAFGIENITPEEQAIIDDIDNTMLHYEFLALADERIYKEEPEIFGEYSFGFKDFKEVENEYLELFNRLLSKVLLK
ncbi:MAG: phosphohydrolase [Oscillospiraceae bacterium]|jgi:hypothetical protein